MTAQQIDSGQTPSSGLGPPRGRVTGHRALPLVILPLLIVLLLTVVWLAGSWLWRASYDPQALISAMRSGDRAAWQKAYALAELLRDGSPDSVRYDREACRALASLLDERLVARVVDPDGIRFQVFLCRLLGEFHVADGLPVLVAATRASPGVPQDGTIRRAALESIAVLAGNIGGPAVEGHPQAVTALLDACRVEVTPDSPAETRSLVSAAVFALGVVGGEAAMVELTSLLDHAVADVRSNAATGLARHGQPQALPVLLEMLDPDSQSAFGTEPTDASLRQKQMLVMCNAVRAALQLTAHNPSLDTDCLVVALQRVSGAASVPERARLDARAALLELARRATPEARSGKL